MRISSALILYEFIAFIDCELLIVGPFADGGTGGRVQDFEPAPARFDLGRLARDGNVAGCVEVVAKPRDGVVEQALGGGISALPHPYDVVSPVQTPKSVIKLVDARPGAFAGSNASYIMRFWYSEARARRPRMRRNQPSTWS